MTTRKPTELNSAAFELEVAYALSHLWEYRRLGTRPLSQLCATQQFLPSPKTTITHLDRGQAVHHLILYALTLLQTSAAGPDTPEARAYAVLDKAYVARLKNHQAAKALGMSESTFYRIRREAVHCLSDLIAEVEMDHRLTVGSETHYPIST